MFTVEQVKAAHAKVRSGTDFPGYIREIKAMGVTGFETWVMDSHTEYYGANDYRASSKPMYEGLTIADSIDAALFRDRLVVHQRGETDYHTFCRDCADTGIEKWIVDLAAMTCTYYDKTGEEVLVERIPVSYLFS